MKSEEEEKQGGKGFFIFLQVNWKKLVGVLGIAVAFSTFYFLMLPGISMESNRKALNCNLEIHSHSDACYDEEGNLICGLADFVVHSHNDDCYDEDGNLVCKLEEIEEHVHSEECYTEEINEETGEKERKLTCTKPEVELHTHGTECYETIKNDDGTETKKLICGKLEVKSHVHGQGCFEESPAETESDDDESLVNEKSENKQAPMLMASAPRRASATNNWQVKVDKTWSDGSTDHEPVVVNLMTRDEDGSESNTGKTITLSSANNWTASFTGLYKDDSFEYFVKEQTPDNWTASVQDSEPLFRETWNRVSAVESGETYVIVPDGYSNTVQLTSITYSTYSGASYGSVSLDYYNINDYVPHNMRWVITKQSTGKYRIFNKGYNQYFVYYTMSGYKVWGGVDSDEVSGYAGASHSIISGDENYTFRIKAAGAYNIFNSNYDFRLYKLSTTVYGQEISIVNKLKPNSDEDPNKVSLEHNKTIDYLGDGIANTDTAVQSGSFQSDDLYRLYLDVKGTPDPPVDLLLVLDRSGSMSEKDMTNYQNETISRAQAINDFLNGDGANEGFIKAFLDANKSNRLSIVDFGGNGYAYSTAAKGYVYSKDASVLRDWGRNYSDAAFSYKSEGTNYSAGLTIADKQFDSLETISSGDEMEHKKIMVFLSDGVPTFYIDLEGNRQGNGDSSDINGDYCKDPTKEWINSFVGANPEVAVHSVGFFGNSQQVAFSTEVLEYMASVGGGEYNHASSAAQLTEHLLALTSTSDVSITDNLSANVNYFTSQPDLKMTMKNTKSGVEYVLYEGGEITSVGRDIIKEISYAPANEGKSTGKVVATFVDSYNLDPNCKYTVSFNVEVTNEAYEAYIDDGGKYSDVGDPGTDYGTNTTSSKKAGFFSNESAYVAYALNGYKNTEYYDDPVVQVSKVKLEILKTNMDGTAVLPGAKFALYRQAQTGENGAVAVEGLTGKYVKIQDLTSDENGTAISKDIKPDNYYLVETEAPEGFTKLKEPVKIMITKKESRALTNNSSVIGKVVTEGNPVLTVKNGTTYVLPETGGIGRIPIEILGGVILLSSLLLTMERRRQKKRESG